MENAGFYVYLWSIYGNIATSISFLTIVAWCMVAFYLVILFIDFMDGTKIETSKISLLKVVVTVASIISVITIVLPRKEHLPYIIAATPLSKAIIDSAANKDGKLNKLNDLINMSLDKAIEAVQKKEQ